MRTEDGRTAGGGAGVQTVAGAPPEWLGRVLAEAPRRLVKRNPRREVWRLAAIGEEAGAGGTGWYVKTFRPASIWDRLAGWMGHDPARREWEVLGTLTDHAERARAAATAEGAGDGAPACPPPVALGRGPGGMRVLVTREVASAGTLGEWLCGEFAGMAASGKLAALRAVGRGLAGVSALLQRAGVTVTDLHEGNFLVTGGGAGGVPGLVLLDLHQAGGPSGRRGAAGAAPGGVAQGLAWVEHTLRPVLSAVQRLAVWRGFVAAARDEAAVRGDWAELQAVCEAPASVHRGNVRRGLRWDAEGRRLPSDRAEARAIAEVERLADEYAARQNAKRDRRMVQSGRYAARLVLGGGWRAQVMLLQRSDDDLGVPAPVLELSVGQWRKALADPDGMTRGPAGARVLKDSRSVLVTAGVLPGTDLDVVVKRPRWKRWGQRFAAMVLGGRARRAWCRGHALLHRGLPTPAPLALLERGIAGMPMEQMLICRHVNGVMDLDAWMESLPVGDGRETEAGYGTASREDRRQADTGGTGDAGARAAGQVAAVAEAMGRLLRRLHDAGFAHRDAKGSNFLLRWTHGTGGGGEGGAGGRGTVPEPWLVDMDGIRFRGVVTRGERVESLARLADWSLTGAAASRIARTARMRCLAAYVRDWGGPAWEVRGLARDVAGAVAGRIAARG